MLCLCGLYLLVIDKLTQLDDLVKINFICIGVRNVSKNVLAKCIYSKEYIFIVWLYILFFYRILPIRRISFGSEFCYNIFCYFRGPANFCQKYLFPENKFIFKYLTLRFQFLCRVIWLILHFQTSHRNLCCAHFTVVASYYICSWSYLGSCGVSFLVRRSNICV